MEKLDIYLQDNTELQVKVEEDHKEVEHLVLDQVEWGDKEVNKEWEDKQGVIQLVEIQKYQKWEDKDQNNKK